MCLLFYVYVNFIIINFMIKKKELVSNKFVKFYVLNLSLYKKNSIKVLKNKRDKKKKRFSLFAILEA